MVTVLHNNLEIHNKNDPRAYFSVFLENSNIFNLHSIYFKFFDY